MILGMSLSTFTMVHVVLSLVGLAAGIISLFGMLRARTLPGVTALFLIATSMTSATGFLFPSTHIGVGHVTGALSLVALVPTMTAIYVHHLVGSWRWIYLVGFCIALWLNALIGIRQAFAKLAYLRPLADTPIELMAQGMLLTIIATMGALTVGYFHPPTNGTPLSLPSSR